MSIEEKLDCVYFAKKLAPHIKIEKTSIFDDFPPKSVFDCLMFVSRGIYELEGIVSRAEAKRRKEMIEIFDKKNARRIAYQTKRYLELGLSEEEFDAYTLIHLIDSFLSSYGSYTRIKDKESFENAISATINATKYAIDDELSFDYAEDKKIKVNKKVVLSTICAEVYSRNKPVLFLDNLLIKEGFKVELLRLG